MKQIIKKVWQASNNKQKFCTIPTRSEIKEDGILVQVSKLKTNGEGLVEEEKIFEVVRVWKNKANGKLGITIPSKSDINAGDYVRIRILKTRKETKLLNLL